MAEATAIGVEPPGDGGGGDSLPRPGPGTCTGTQVEIWDNKSFYFATDHLGTVRAVYEGVTDATTGQKLLEARFWHDYEPYGIELFPASTADDERHRFTGHERDQETGNDYMHFRMYQDALGRFLKPDNISGNIGDPQSWNLYTYVRSNPVNLTDPTGHMYWQTGSGSGDPVGNVWINGVAIGKNVNLTGVVGGTYGNVTINTDWKAWYKFYGANGGAGQGSLMALMALLPGVMRAQVAEAIFTVAEAVHFISEAHEYYEQLMHVITLAEMAKAFEDLAAEFPQEGLTPGQVRSFRAILSRGANALRSLARALEEHGEGGPANPKAPRFINAAKYVVMSISRLAGWTYADLFRGNLPGGFTLPEEIMEKYEENFFKETQRDSFPWSSRL